MEIWKDIYGYKGIYQVSNFGQIKSFKAKQPLILKGRPSQDGYLRVELRKEGKSKAFMIARLVAQHFIPNLYDKPTVNHIDGNKINNHVSNLEWSNRDEQMVHAYKLGLKPRMDGYKNKRSLLTAEQVREIRSRYKRGCKVNGMKALAEEFGISFVTCDKVIRKVSYKNV